MFLSKPVTTIDEDIRMTCLISAVLALALLMKMMITTDLAVFLLLVMMMT